MTLFFLASFVLFSDSPQAVTYSFSGGRFGDNLLTYLHAKWLSYEHQVPLAYKPFPYSTELILDEREPSIEFFQDVELVECPYFPENEFELGKHPYFHFQVDWENHQFRQIAREMISPKEELQLIYPPPGRISVAIHVREGGGKDPDGFTLRDPLKCPPVAFYAECFKTALNLLKGKPIYCRLFTDALHPEEIADAILLGVDDPSRVVMEYRREDNNPDANVLEDFFSLFHYDILIRPESNFSIIPSLLHDFALVFSPHSFWMEEDHVYIDEVNFKMNEELYRRLL